MIYFARVKIVFMNINSRSKRFKLIASCYLLYIRKNKILLLRRQNTGYEDGKYSVPAGHLEDGESLTEGMIRETREEIGIDLDPKSLHFAHVMHRKQEDIRIDFFFFTNDVSGEPVNAEPDKSDDLRWFDLDKLPQNIVPYVSAAIEYVRSSVWFSEFGWEK